jgi:hypothetical protein
VFRNSPQPARRKKVVEGEEKENFRVGAPVITTIPNPPVQMLNRNLRRDFPKSFARPKI